jgi:hypothetical protein
MAEPSQEAMAKALTEWAPQAGGAMTRGATAADELEFSDLFSVRRPKNVLAGLSSGTQSALKGVTAGVATLIAAPIVGAKQEGTSGFFKGLGAGARPASANRVWFRCCAALCMRGSLACVRAEASKVAT